ncbi:hypothetical protein [Streptomyces malaysiensis]
MSRGAVEKHISPATAVEKHINATFEKLELRGNPGCGRRVLAVPRHLGS